MGNQQGGHLRKNPEKSNANSSSTSNANKTASKDTDNESGLPINQTLTMEVYHLMLNNSLLPTNPIHTFYIFLKQNIKKTLKRSLSVIMYIYIYK